MLAAFVSAVALLTLPPTDARHATERALVPLKKGASGHAEQKTCFACHNQAPPMLAFATAKERGFDIPANLLESQAEHVVGFLDTNRDRFKDSRGTGGQAA